jgi:hypothetical protein
MPLETINIGTLEKIVLGKCESFVTMGLWPPGNKLRPRKWLENFNNSEKEHALYLLNAFCYFNADLTTAVLKATVMQLTNELEESTTIDDEISKWNLMLSETVFIPSTGESPNVTDSGLILSNYLRRNLKVPECQVLTTAHLYNNAYTGVFDKMKNVVFFDDLIGSGTQLKTMYGEDFEKETNLLPPIREQCKVHNLKPYYCSLMATEYGIDEVKKLFPELKLYVGHILQQNISPFHVDNNIWPERLKSSGIDFINSASLRAGIPQNEIKGYHDLGLTIAFDLTIPDATLPIYRWNQNNWSALMEKS